MITTDRPEYDTSSRGDDAEEEGSFDVDRFANDMTEDTYGFDCQK